MKKNCLQISSEFLGLMLQKVGEIEEKVSFPLIGERRFIVHIPTIKFEKNSILVPFSLVKEGKAGKQYTFSLNSFRVENNILVGSFRFSGNLLLNATNLIIKIFLRLIIPLILKRVKSKHIHVKILPGSKLQIALSPLFTEMGMQGLEITHFRIDDGLDLELRI